ncbi:hypothetical protein RRG08_044363 [Elysia crispata]|uniref:Uncharacterized protein n=1 Tax=Elysia crispata TaxID=231223 RepID=A0AAE1DVS3_9GAST|nr:hypothetical protein RRG08_044363 [Elysia crispata]
MEFGSSSFGDLVTVAARWRIGLVGPKVLEVVASGACIARNSKHHQHHHNNKSNLQVGTCFWVTVKQSRVWAGSDLLHDMQSIVLLSLSTS